MNRNLTLKVFKKSKWFHKFIGLIIIPFSMWMSVSGIFLNHPDLISGISLSGNLIPGNYHPHNWNRSSMVSVVFSEKDTNVIFIGGKQGIWHSLDGGKHFIRFEDEFEKSWYYKKTSQLILHENDSTFLMAATAGGLWINNLKNGKWYQIPLIESHEPVKKILSVGDTFLVFSDSHVYHNNSAYPDFNFSPVKWTRNESPRSVTLVDLFFHLHDGSIWGLPGKLIFDLTGIMIFFLSLSAFYIWFIPKRIQHSRQNKVLSLLKKKINIFHFFFKYHLKLGIWFALLLLIIGGTGFFMRPPILAAIAEGNIPATWYPGNLPENQWDKKVKNVLYDSIENILVVETTDGFLTGPLDFSTPFRKETLNVPLFVMGATVFEPYGKNGYLVGSFNGLYHLERYSKKSYDLIYNNYIEYWSNVKPSDYMVTGYFKTPSGKEFITTHKQGILPLDNNLETEPAHFSMPAELADEFRIPLWNFLFELHNGRLFENWVGAFYILMVPLGSMFFVLIILSGIIDWSVNKVIKRKNL